MDENSRRAITWVVVIAIILCITVTAADRRGELKRMANLIGTGTPQERILAVRTLVKHQKLQEALVDQPRWVQDMAVATVQQIGTDAALFELFTCHGPFDAPVQARDQVVVSRTGRRNIEALVEGIQDKDGGVRGAAVTPLTNVGKAIETEKGIASNDVIDAGMQLLDAWDQYVRDNVVVVMSGIATPRVTEKLIPVMLQDEPGKKKLADGKVRDQTTQEFMRAKATARASLVTMKKPAYDSIFKHLITAKNGDTRAVASQMLGDIAVLLVPATLPADVEPVVKPLLGRLMNDDQFNVRRRAANSLGLLGNVAATPALLEPLMSALKNNVVPKLITRLSDEDPVKAACAEALGKIADPKAIQPLVNTLMTNRSGATKEIRIALTALGEPAIPSVIRALSHPEAEVRHVATQAIAEIGGKNAVTPLGSMLKDSDLSIRRVASAALRDAADQRVLPQLAAALNDDDWQVYNAARDALANVGAPAVPVLVNALADVSPRVTTMATDALARIGKPALPLLQATLSSANLSQAHWAGLAMGAVGFDAYKPALAVLVDMTKSVNARAMAAVALGRCGAGDAVKPLMTTAMKQEVPVRKYAVSALVQLGNELATPGIVTALKDASVEVRDEALDALRHWRKGDVLNLLAEVVKSGDENAKRRANILIAEHTTVAAHELIEQVASIVKVNAKEETSAQGVKADLKMLEATALDTREANNLRLRSINALGYAGNENSLESLANLLKPNNRYAAEAAVAAARLGARTAQKVLPGKRPKLTNAGRTLVDLLLATSDMQLRARCGASLSLMGEQSVWELISRINKSSDDLKPWIVGSLGAIGKPATDPILEIRGASKNADERKWLAIALELIGDAQALELLKHLPDEEKPTPEMRTAAESVRDQIRLVTP